jgi:hypothetical protein
LKAALNFRGVATARGSQWTAVQVRAILHRVGHFASGRSTKQQTNNKQQAKLTPSDSAIKGGEAREVIDENHRYPVLKTRLVDECLHPAFGKVFSWQKISAAGRWLGFYFFSSKKIEPR